jgi:hypothetical protein
MSKVNMEIISSETMISGEVVKILLDKLYE